jgi:hypothetical protein
LAEHILFLTGKLAEVSLQKVLRDMRPTEFTYHIHQLGLSVAALMTTDLIACRLKDTQGADPETLRCLSHGKALLHLPEALEQTPATRASSSIALCLVSRQTGGVYVQASAASD